MQLTEILNHKIPFYADQAGCAILASKSIENNYRFKPEATDISSR